MNIKTENGSPMMCEQLTLEQYQKQTCGASDFRAKTSVLPDPQSASEDLVQVCFSQLQTLLGDKRKRIDPSIYLLRTLKTYLVLIGGEISQSCSLSWTKLGTMRNGKFSIPSISEFRRTENDALLSDILEVQVPQKYFLSKEQTQKIVFTSSDTETDTDETRRSSIPTELPKPSTPLQGGVENLIPESNSWGGLGEAKSNNNTQFFQQDRVYEAEAIATSLTSGLPGGANLYGINIIGTLDEKRHSQMDVIGGGGIHPTLTTLNEKPKVGVSLSEILTHPVEG